VGAVLGEFVGGRVGPLGALVPVYTGNCVGALVSPVNLVGAPVAGRELGGIERKTGALVGGTCGEEATVILFG